jgi:hypothetical protein
MKRLSLALIIVAFLVAALFAVSIVEAQDTSDLYTTPEPTAEPTPTPLPTPAPTPQIVPGSPLTVGSATFQELLSQLDIMSLAQIVLVGLGLMWIVIIGVTVGKKLLDKLTSEKREPQS